MGVGERARWVLLLFASFYLLASQRPQKPKIDERCCKKIAKRRRGLVWLEELVELIGGIHVATACLSRLRSDISDSSAQTPASKRTRAGEESTPLSTLSSATKG